MIKQNLKLSFDMLNYYVKYTNYIQKKRKDITYKEPKFSDYCFCVQFSKSDMDLFENAVYNLMECGVNGIDYYIKIKAICNESENMKHYIFNLDGTFIIFTVQNKSIISIKSITSL
jgi:hypothetical protein